MSILEEISSMTSLRLAWERLNKSNQESYGIDYVKLKHFKDNLDKNLESISNKLKKGTYRFLPYRLVSIPKKDGKKRPLQISCISDRIVLKAIAIVSEKCFEETLEKSKGISFAYQKKIGIKDAIEKIVEHHKKINHYIFESDLVIFFTEVNRDT